MLDTTDIDQLRRDRPTIKIFVTFERISEALMDIHVRLHVRFKTGVFKARLSVSVGLNV